MKSSKLRQDWTPGISRQWSPQRRREKWSRQEHCQWWRKLIFPSWFEEITIPKTLEETKRVISRLCNNLILCSTKQGTRSCHQSNLREKPLELRQLKTLSECLFKPHPKNHRFWWIFKRSHYFLKTPITSKIRFWGKSFKWDPQRTLSKVMELGWKGNPLCRWWR